MGNSKFFTNEPEKDLYTRFTKILQSNTQFFDVLVGYFRTSGFFMMKDALADVEKIRILVGLNVDNFTVKIIDSAKQELQYERKTEKEGKDIISHELTAEFADAPEEKQLEDGVRTFIDWLKSGKLEMRMFTEAPLHAKVYVMRKDQNTSDTLGSVITGSSNFSAAGLQNNLEFNVELRDDDDVNFALEKFEELWNKSTDIKDAYIEAVNNKTWIKGDITPYQIYLKTLYEFFKEEINADKDKLANDLLPDDYMRLQYQIDAVVQAKKILESHNGVFISDVVGLGKTYICAMLAKTLKKGRKLIICPPVLVNYWNEVLLEFDVAARVESLGKLDKLLEEGIDNYSYVFIDEAHRFRNDKTESYSKLSEICHGKKVILISATPINNYTDDIRNQLYLFQPKYNGTIVGVKNLEGFFRNLRGKTNKFSKGTDEYNNQLKENSEIIRDKVLRHIMIRRTRGEILRYYASDLEKQHLAFPTLGSPEQIEYVFDDETDNAFTKTITEIRNFKYARYKALAYLIDPGEYSSLVIGAQNMGGFMKGILVKRLESSFYAFKMTLERFIKSYEQFIDMFESGEVYISKKVNVYDLLDSGDTEKLLKLVEEDDAMYFKTEDFRPEFILDLEYDLGRLKYLRSLWKNIDHDPKLDQFIYELNNNPKMAGDKKIIFTESKETADYLERKLSEIYGKRVISYSGQSSLTLKSSIEDSFNPKYVDKNNDKYDVLITTDVLAEGINLHRSNVLINYDLPWNPTRIMQRVGRVNRVGTKFENIYVFNFFPTAQSKTHLSLEDRIMEKLQLFHDTLGDDYKYLSDEEEVTAQGLFEGLNKNLDEDEDGVNPELEYLSLIREIRDKDPDLFETIKKLPIKAKTGRHYDVKEDTTVTFIRKGTLKTFYKTADETEELSFLDAIKYIECEPDEKQIKIKDNYYTHAKANSGAFDDALIADDIATFDKPQIRGNEAKALKYIRALKQQITFTDIQDRNIQLMLDAYENGDVAKGTTTAILKEIESADDPLEIYYIFINNLPDFIFVENRNTNIKHEGKKQVILSEYLVPEDK